MTSETPVCCSDILVQDGFFEQTLWAVRQVTAQVTHILQVYEQK